MILLGGGFSRVLGVYGVFSCAMNFFHFVLTS